MANIDLNPVESEWRDRVKKCWKESSDALRTWHEQVNDDYRLYNNVAKAKEHVRANPPDKDTVAYELATHFGEDLDIPIAYSTIETQLPRIVQNRPRGLVLPDERSADDSVENMRLLVDKQQGAMHYEMLSQDIVKSGCLTGLGIVKGPYWRRVVQPGVPVLQRATRVDPNDPNASQWVTVIQDRVQFDDAWAEFCDVTDCRWDRMASDAHTLRWFAHRTWRDDEYIAGQLGLSPGRELADRSQAAWNTPAAQQITGEDIGGISNAKTAMDSVYLERMRTAGVDDDKISDGLHEVIEYWTARGDRVVLLDGEFPVFIGKSDFAHGQIPFHFYRPQTAGIRQLHGISEIGPLRHLIRELSLMRALRRDNALLALMRVFIFDEDAVDRDDLIYAPGIGIPVRSDDPKAHLYALDIPDIPFSSYRETEETKADLDRTSGIGDTVAGAEGGGAAQTATGAQLITAAANIRIENKSHRFEAETVTPFTNQLISLNQQMIIQKDIRVPRPPQPGEIDPRPWQWITLTPAELAGAMSFHVEGGSIAPKNVAQEMQQAQTLWSQFNGDPEIDQGHLKKFVLEANGVKSASAWILPQPTVPPAFAQVVGKLLGEDKVQQIMALIQEDARG